MQSAGYRIIPVNPFETEVLGEQAYPELDRVPGTVDIVDIFRRSEFVPKIVEAAIRIGARAIWMQEGVVHEDAAAKARTRSGNGPLHPQGAPPPAGELKVLISS
jgi:predicted CoA-binding protein